MMSASEQHAKKNNKKTKRNKQNQQQQQQQQRRTGGERDVRPRFIGGDKRESYGNAGTFFPSASPRPACARTHTHLNTHASTHAHARRGSLAELNVLLPTLQTDSSRHLQSLQKHLEMFILLHSVYFWGEVWLGDGRRVLDGGEIKKGFYVLPLRCLRRKIPSFLSNV